MAAVVLEPVQLTGSGRPVLLPAEVEHLLLDRVDLEFEPHEGGLPGRQAKAYKNGYVIATSHRLLWMEASGGQGPPKSGGFFSSSSGSSGSAAVATASGAGARHCALPVHAIKAVNKRSAFSLSGVKVRLHIDVSMSLDNRPDAKGPKTVPLALRCRGDDPDALAAKLSSLSKTALPSPQHSASRPPPPPPAQPPPPPPTSVAPPPPLPAQAPLLQAPTQPAPRVDPDMLMQLMDMGFPRNRSARALAATGSSDLQAALDFILAFGHQPEMDQPLPDPASAAPQPHHAPIPLYPPPHPAAATMPPHQQSLPWMMGPPQQVLPGRAYPSLPTQPSAQSAPPPLQPHYSSDTLNPLASTPLQQGSLPGAQSAPPSGEGSKLAGGIGIGGIVRREQQKSSQAGQSLSAAFQDLSALMGMAEDMVALANRFRAVSSSNASQMGGAEDDVLDSDTQADLIAMGIASPVTKETAGARYHIELCRQLADFLQEPLNRASGLMPLTDVYCLFNRARGTELVSPDDLLAAALLFQKVQLPLRLRTFPSGFTVIQNASHSDDTVCAAIAQMVQPQQQHAGTPTDPSTLPPKAAALSLSSGKVTALPDSTPSAAFDAPPPPSTTTNTAAAAAPLPDAASDSQIGGLSRDGLEANEEEAAASSSLSAAAAITRMVDAQLGPGITAPDVARALRVATSIAAEHLLTAEARGVVCRDEGPEGTRFFRNFFKDAWPPLVA